MNTEIMNNIEEATELATDVTVDVGGLNIDNFIKGLAVGTVVTLLVEHGPKLVIKGVKKLRSKKYIEAEVVEVTDAVVEESKK